MRSKLDLLQLHGSLHFNEAILSSLRQNGTTLCDSLSLHVGAGTFKPVVSECISGHDMHVERFSASLSDLRSLQTPPERPPPRLMEEAYFNLCRHHQCSSR